MSCGAKVLTRYKLLIDFYFLFFSIFTVWQQKNFWSSSDPIPSWLLLMILQICMILSRQHTKLLIVFLPTLH